MTTELEDLVEEEGRRRMSHQNFVISKATTTGSSEDLQLLEFSVKINSKAGIVGFNVKGDVDPEKGDFLKILHEQSSFSSEQASGTSQEEVFGKLFSALTGQPTVPHVSRGICHA